MANCIFKVVLFFFVVRIFLPCEGSAAINVDGRLNEPEWADAQRFTEFVVVDPLTLEKPDLSTEALVLSTPEGLSVGFICEQPDDETRTRTMTERDARSFNSDSISLMIDFNGDGQIAYEFSVSITDSYRDGTITRETSFNYDWDGVWSHAVNEEQDRWTVEILLPWSIVSMRGSKGEKRRIGVCFQRQLQSKDELYAFPAVSTDRHLFVSEFERIEVAMYSFQDLEIEPYVTALGDLLNDSTIGKAGLDILWKPRQNIHLLATVNPEFGYVESDDLVIDFSAYEVSYTEKRPFFTEDQDVFGSRFSRENLFYTRRIGAASDKDGKVSDIEAALIEGTQRATMEVPIRRNVVEPFTYENPGNNTGWGSPFIYYHYSSKPGPMKLRAELKGFGGEIKSTADWVFTSAESMEDAVLVYVLHNVMLSRGEGCIPGFLGVGVGGYVSEATVNAKNAVFRELSQEVPPTPKNTDDRFIRSLEHRIFRCVNRLGLGPMGGGGNTTTLGVYLERRGTHTAVAPVSVSQQCWASRGSEAAIRGNQVTFLTPHFEKADIPALREEIEAIHLNRSREGRDSTDEQQQSADGDKNRSAIYVIGRFRVRFHSIPHGNDNDNDTTSLPPQKADRQERP